MSKRGGKSYWSNWRTVRANVARHLEDFSVQQVPSITESSNSVETSQCTSNSLVENEKPCDQVFDNNSIVQELNNDISSQSDYDSEDRSINHSPNRIYDCLIDSSSAEGSSDDDKKLYSHRKTAKFGSNYSSSSLNDSAISCTQMSNKLSVRCMSIASIEISIRCSS